MKRKTRVKTHEMKSVQNPIPMWAARGISLAIACVCSSVLAADTPPHLASSGPGAIVDEGQKQADEIRLLRAENTLLKATIARLTGQVKQLQELSRNAGIALPPPTTASAATPPGTPRGETYMYLGRPRDKAWFERMYKAFADKIVRVDGKYLDVGKALVGGSEVPGVAGIGGAGATPIGSTVMDVIDKSQVLIRIYWPWGPQGMAPIVSSHSPDYIFHVTGVTTKGMVDGAPFRADLVCIGTHHYTTVSGAGATVPSYTIRRWLTQEQFAEALAGNLQLVSYRRVEQRRPGRDPEIKVLGTPVP